MRCLYCHQTYQLVPTWTAFLKPDFRKGFCPLCNVKMERLENRLLCRDCGRDLVLMDSQFVSKSSTDLCLDCERWGNKEVRLFNKNRSVYLYNDFMKDMIARFKFRGDAELANGFRTPMREIYRKHFRSYLIVPVPLSEERLYERCFNQAQLLADQLPGKMLPLLVRPVHSSKQSKKTRRERLSMTENPFMINPELNEPIKGEKILLVDDIYTTGTTVRQAANALQPLNPEVVCSLTLARAD